MTEHDNASSGHAADHPHGPPTVVIHIDHDQFRVDATELTGRQLRALPDPDVPVDRDLWQEVPGGSDVKVNDDEVVELKNGMHFFTAPREINPGHDAAAG